MRSQKLEVATRGLSLEVRKVRTGALSLAVDAPTWVYDAEKTVRFYADAQLLASASAAMAEVDAYREDRLRKLGTYMVREHSLALAENAERNADAKLVRYGSKLARSFDSKVDAALPDYIWMRDADGQLQYVPTILNIGSR